MKTFFAILSVAALILLTTESIAQVAPLVGKNYVVKWGTEISSGINGHLSTKFNGTSTSLNMNRMDNQSKWTLEKSGSNYHLFSPRHKVYLSAAAEPSVTKEQKERLNVKFVKAVSGKYYISTPGNLYLAYVNRKFVYLPSSQVLSSKDPQAEWEFYEIFN